MVNSPVTIIINGLAHKIDSNDSSTISKLSKQERSDLIDILSAVKAYDLKSQSSINAVAEKARGVTSDVNPSSVKADSYQQDKSARLSGQEVDDLMSRLALEEKRNQKPGLTKKGVYKFLLAVVVIVFLVVIIF